MNTTDKNQAKADATRTAAWEINRRRKGEARDENGGSRRCRWEPAMTWS
jgi:hypothetical protein